MATHGTVSITIGATPQQVWPWIVDLTRHSQWSPKPYQVAVVSGEPGAVGSRYRSVGWVPPNDGDHENDVEITQVVPMTRFVFHASDASGTFVNAFDLTPVVQGTQVRFELVFPPMNGLSALMVSVLFPLVGMPDIRKRMGLLKATVEAASPAG